MKALKYSFYEAPLNIHPRKDMERLGYEIVKAIPQPIGDCWWFLVKNDVETKVPYIYEMDMEVFNKFSSEYSNVRLIGQVHKFFDIR